MTQRHSERTNDKHADIHDEHTKHTNV